MKQKRAVQFSLDRYLPRHQRKRIAYGGQHIRGHRKVKRPVDPRFPLHVVLKSTKARGAWSFLAGGNRRFIAELLERLARAHGVKVLEWENVGNHLHLVLRFKDRNAPGRFLRVFAARISMRFMGLKKGRSGEQVLGKGEKFWDDTPFSRVVYEAFRAGFGLAAYLRKNHYEGLGWDAKPTRLFAAQLPPGFDFGPPLRGTLAVGTDQVSECGPKTLMLQNL